MKLNLEPGVKGLGTAASSLARARRGLRQAVGVVLSDSLEALNEHIATQWLATPRECAEAAQTHAHRLREVLANDRALAAQPPPTAVEPEPTLEPEPDLEPVRDDDLTASAAPPTEPVPSETEPVVPSGPDLSAVRAVPSPLTASEKRERKRAPRREPIRTRTMAQVLISQGEHERALTIYEELVLKDGGRDPTLTAEFEALRARVGDKAVLSSPDAI